VEAEQNQWLDLATNPCDKRARDNADVVKLVDTTDLKSWFLSEKEQPDHALRPVRADKSLI
jgi:hypothetical protein